MIEQRRELGALAEEPVAWVDMRAPRSSHVIPSYFTE